jgi:choline kinase
MAVNRVERAVILSAGKGSRLLPLTADRPKCLIELAGKTLLEWQLDALSAGGIREIVVVTGFRPDLVDAVVAARDPALGSIRTVFNPFYHVADNLGSAWMAREAMDRDFVLLNGDTLVAPAIVERLAEAEEAPISIAVDRKADYDEDDMKVLCEGRRVVRIDKKLEPGSYNAESIGFLRFMGEGPRLFVEAADRVLRTAEGTGHFYLRVIDRLADTGIVAAEGIEGLEWAEVDFPQDLDKARELTARWRDAASDGRAPARA